MIRFQSNKYCRYIAASGNNLDANPLASSEQESEKQFKYLKAVCKELYKAGREDGKC